MQSDRFAVARNILIFACVCAAGWLSSASAAFNAGQAPELPGASLIMRFVRETSMGYAALEADSAQVALQRFGELASLVPQSPRAHCNIACARARLGQLDEARAAFERAIDLGYAEIEEVEEDPDIAPLRAQKYWPDLLERMHGNLESMRSALAAQLAHPAAQDDPVFTDLDSLKAHFGEMERRTGGAARIYGRPTVSRMQLDIMMRKLAALDRMLSKTTDDSLALPIRLEILRTRAGFADLEERPWTVGRKSALATARDFRARYPQSEEAAVAALWIARAEWYGKMRAKIEETPKQDCEAAITELRSVASSYPQTPGGCQALAEAIQITAESSARDMDRVRPLFEELEAGCKLDRNLLGDLYYSMNEYRLQVHGVPDFSATDIDGREWKLLELRGKPVLLDFWATWCGPCVAELPTVVRMRRQYPESKLTILGISLDRGDRLTVDALRAWMAKKGMDWPQIFGGEGWQAALPKLYQVSSIPFPVLLGADGSVVAAGEGARGKKLEQKLAELLGS